MLVSIKNLQTFAEYQAITQEDAQDIIFDDWKIDHKDVEMKIHFSYLDAFRQGMYFVSEDYFYFMRNAISELRGMGDYEFYRDEYQKLLNNPVHYLPSNGTEDLPEYIFEQTNVLAWYGDYVLCFNNFFEEPDIHHIDYFRNPKYPEEE